jgi:hypothetical protein
MYVGAGGVTVIFFSGRKEVVRPAPRKEACSTQRFIVVRKSTVNGRGGGRAIAVHQPLGGTKGQILLCSGADGKGNVRPQRDEDLFASLERLRKHRAQAECVGFADERRSRGALRERSWRAPLREW